VTDQLESGLRISSRIVAGDEPVHLGIPVSETPGTGMSTGRRIAREIRIGQKQGRLADTPGADAIVGDRSKSPRKKSGNTFMAYQNAQPSMAMPGRTRLRGVAALAIGLFRHGLPEMRSFARR